MAIPAPIPAFAAVLRSGWATGVEAGVVDVAVAGAAVVRDSELNDAEKLGRPDKTLNAVTEDAKDALVEVTTAFPTVAARVNSLELVLQ